MSENENSLPTEEPQVSEAPAVEAPEAPEAPAAPEESKVHPAYEKLLAELPEAWHNKIIPHLQEQDKYFQQQLEKYTPFKEFMEYDPNVLRDSLKLADVAVNDPVALYRNLAEHLRSQGLLDQAAEADKAADAAEDGEKVDLDDYEIDPAIKKEFERRDALLQQQQEMLESIEYEKQVAEETRVLESQISEINSQYDIPDATMDKILKLMEVQLERGEDATVYTAARELAEITGIKYRLRTDLPKEDAPIVAGSSGGAGIPAERLSVPKDDRGKRQMLEQMFQAQLKAQQ
jgi:uncharacterized protein with PhoU and TrkA domain